MRMTKRLTAATILVLSFWIGSPATLSANDFTANTGVAAEALQRWYNHKGLWDTTDWWNAANCVEAIENVIQVQNGGPYLEVLDKTFRENKGRDFLNDYYDDEGWWALAWIRAFDLTGDARYLKMAKTIFVDMTGGWDDHCGGGIWWRKDRRYKNAIANELFLLVAIRLHQRTPGDAGPGSYFDWAIREWTWFKNTGMINADNLVNDGLNRDCKNNGQTTWTYNQGVILGGLTELYKVTGDVAYLDQATAIADAALKTLSCPLGVLRESCEPERCGGADVPQFKGIFIRYLADLYDVTRKPAYSEMLFASAQSVWRNNRNASNQFGLLWTGPIDSVDAARHSSAMMAITAVAEPSTRDLIFAKGSGNPAFKHEIGAPVNSSGWRCDPRTTTQSGWMQSGSCIASLPAGRHTVHFQMAVSTLSASSAGLATLDVRDTTSGTVLAERRVQWKEFLEAGVAQDFAVSFTNQTSGNALEFRIYWNHVSDGPALTATDITIGDHRAWTAANLAHDVGRLDGLNAWTADPVRDQTPGFLTRDANARELESGKYEATFELKVDNFNWDDSKVATISVVDADNGKSVATRDLKRGDFSTVLYRGFALQFTATEKKRYDFRTFWHQAPRAPRLTQRSVIVKSLASER
jgi:predicted alpha-1,6-mannanase (GH76 family)